MPCNSDTEKLLYEKFYEWKRSQDIFDFHVNQCATLTCHPTRRRDTIEQTTGMCRGRREINISYGTDAKEALHTLLHEMCHLNCGSRGHDKIFNRSMAYACEKITGVKIDWNRPMRKVDRDVAVAFGSHARTLAVENSKLRKDINDQNWLESLRVGQPVYIFVKNGEYEDEVHGRIVDINKETLRCHVQTERGIFSRKVNKIGKIYNYRAEN